MTVQVVTLKPIDQMSDEDAKKEVLGLWDLLRHRKPGETKRLFRLFAGRAADLKRQAKIQSDIEIDALFRELAWDLGLNDHFDPDYIESIIRDAVSKGDVPSVYATPYVWQNPQHLPMREWLYGQLLIRKFVSATVSPGGVGKSSLVAAETLAQVTGRNLLGVKPSGTLRVWLWNLEDPQEETERKLQAAALHYGVGPQEIDDRLFVDSGRDQPLVIAHTTRSGAQIARPVVNSLVEEIRRRAIDVLHIDPFVSSHEVAENDNSAQDMVVKEWGRVAEWGNCAVHLVDHTRKMGGEAEVTAESARGGKAKTDACRVVRAINRMTVEQGKDAGVENHRLYFRTYNDKANLTPPADKSDWFRLASVDLPNGHLGCAGDSVGVVANWTWPDLLAGVTGADFEKAASVIRSGAWRADAQASAWVGRAIAQALELNLDLPADKAKVKALLKLWRQSGALIEVEGADEKRRPRKFVEVKEDEEIAA